MSQSVDQLFEKMLKDAGLYGKAFQHHKVTRKEARKIRSIRRAAEILVNNREEFLKSLAKENANVS